MSDVSEQHGLYQAAVGFMVASRSDADSWEHIARWTHKMALQAVSIEAMNDEFKMVEKQIKQDFSITTMPKAWRSAKSTALKAVGAGVRLVLDDKVVGKTEVTKNTKQASAIAAVPSANFAEELNRELVNLHRKWQTNRFNNTIFLGNLKSFVAQVEAHA